MAVSAVTKADEHQALRLRALVPSWDLIPLARLLHTPTGPRCPTKTARQPSGHGNNTGGPKTRPRISRPLSRPQ